jgi:hypothetical protein
MEAKRRFSQNFYPAPASYRLNPAVETVLHARKNKGKTVW